MSHINADMPPVSGSREKTLRLKELYGGTVFCDSDSGLSPTQSPYINNFIFENGILRSRFGRKRLELDIPTGKVHSNSGGLFFGEYILHIGESLIAFDGENITGLSVLMPDCDSFMFEMNSTMYIFCSCGRIFMVQKNLSVSEHIIPVPVIATEAKYDYSEYTPGEAPDSMLTRYVSVSYKSRVNGVSYFKLPTECEPESTVSFMNTNTNVVIYPKYTINGDTIELESTLEAPCLVTYRPKRNGKFGHSDKIFGCTTTTCYGGYSGGGTRVFFSGNKDYPGYFFHSEFLSPLDIRELSYDIVGNGSENINCLAKQKGELIALCDRSIYGITYSFDNTDGPEFTVHEVSSHTGCDIPESVQLIDNRLVFANSSSGVHIIVASDYTDELSVRSISANINGTAKSPGLLSEKRESLDGCISADFGRKYYLVCGSGNCYVWDYGASPYVLSSNPQRSETALAWYFFTDIGECFLGELAGKLYGICRKDEENCMVLYTRDQSSDFDGSINSEYRSREFDLSASEAKKVLRELFVSITEGEGAQTELLVFADGKKIAASTFTHSEAEQAIRRLYMKVHGYEAYRFSFAVRCVGDVGIHDAVLKFRSNGIYYR